MESAIPGLQHACLPEFEPCFRVSHYVDLTPTISHSNFRLLEHTLTLSISSTILIIIALLSLLSCIMPRKRKAGSRSSGSDPAATPKKAKSTTIADRTKTSSKSSKVAKKATSTSFRRRIQPDGFLEIDETESVIHTLVEHIANIIVSPDSTPPVRATSRPRLYSKT